MGVDDPPAREVSRAESGGVTGGAAGTRRWSS